MFSQLEKASHVTGLLQALGRAVQITVWFGGGRLDFSGCGLEFELKKQT